MVILWNPPLAGERELRLSREPRVSPVNGVGSSLVYGTPKSIPGDGEAPEKPSLPWLHNLAAEGEVGSDVCWVHISLQLAPSPFH